MFDDKPNGAATSPHVFSILEWRVKWWHTQNLCHDFWKYLWLSMCKLMFHSQLPSVRKSPLQQQAVASHGEPSFLIKPSQMFFLVQQLPFSMCCIELFIHPPRKELLLHPAIIFASLEPHLWNVYKMLIMCFVRLRGKLREPVISSKPLIYQTELNRIF